MPPKRRKVNEDEDVIRTEPDKRRAIDGGEEDDEIEEIERTANASSDISYAIVTNGRSKTLVSRQRAKTTTSSFPFLLLPAEIRNMIYRYLVVSKNPKPIVLDTSAWFPNGGIQTAILATNRQIFHEAGRIMYGENRCVANIAEWVGGLSLRHDDPKSKLITTKSLRSGRTIDMVTSQGLIYEHVATRLKNLEFRIDIFDRKPVCRFHAVRISRILRVMLEKTFATFLLRHKQMMRDKERATEKANVDGNEETKTASDITDQTNMESEQTVEDRNEIKQKVKGKGKQKHKNKQIDDGMGWRVVISAKDTSRVMLERFIQPMMRKEVAKMVKDGELKLIVTGLFPKGWEELFNKFGKSPNFDHGSVQIDPSAINEEEFGFSDKLQFYKFPTFGTDMDRQDAEGLITVI